MTIAAHIESSANTTSFLAEYIVSLAQTHPQQQFVIFSSKQASHGFKFPSNCKQVTIKPIIRNSLLLHYWYHYKLPGLLIKHNAAVFISEKNACCMRTTVPQALLINQLPTQPPNFPGRNDYQYYYKRYFSRFAAKAQAVCTTQHYIETELIKQYPLLAEKTQTILHGLHPAFNVIAGEKKEDVLARYSEGHEYFLCECSSFTGQNLLGVLKAFSIFKKRLKSGMRLIVLNTLPTIPIKDFKNYKYRDEVVFLSNFTRDEEQLLISAAYAAVYMPSFSGAGSFGLDCMQSAVPLICIKALGYESMYQSAAMYATNNEKEIAECLMSLYKDEVSRGKLIAEGKALIKNYNWHDSSSKLWQTILNYIPV